MLRKLIMLILISVIGMGSANAATLFLPGASGIPDENQPASNGCIVDVVTGTMLIQPYPNQPNNDCLMSYPITLPLGSTITGVEIAYYGIGASGNSIAAYLGENRFKPFLGAIALGGANDFIVSPSFQVLFMNMGQLNVPVANGNIYWVQVATHRILQVDYVSVTYH